MAEKTLTLDTAVDSLPDLSHHAESNWDRYVITHTGRPQSVLLSYQEYMGMKETIVLLQQPGTIAQLDQALRDVSHGKRILWDSSAEILSNSGPVAKARSLAKKKFDDNESELTQTS